MLQSIICYLWCRELDLNMLSKSELHIAILDMALEEFSYFPLTVVKKNLKKKYINFQTFKYSWFNGVE